MKQKEFLKLHDAVQVPQPMVPMVPRTPKKTHLEQLPRTETTSAMMRIITGGRAKCLPEYFEHSCDRWPHKTAIICDAAHLTYQELDQRANRLAHYLLSCGIETGNPIGILLERSLDTYVALLGVLKAGAAFVPLDPSSSAELVTFIAEDAELRGMVTNSAFREKTSTLACPVLELDQAHEELSTQPETRPSISISPSSLCYIMYTGTLKRTKGVAVSHANIVNFLRVITLSYGVTRHDRVYHGMSMAFDFSFEEIWPTWIVGATLFAGPTNSQHLGSNLTKFLIGHRITVLCCVPALLATIERDVPSLRLIILGGGVCPAYLVNSWSRPGRRMLSTYGHPETTVKATWCELFPGRPVTLGSPLPTYHVYILDDGLAPVEDGKSGEIYIGGPGVAISYHNRPNLTKECFIPNPILRDREIVPRLYRTGEIGRVTSAGEIEYLGRVDTEETLRVVRIKSEEIEQAAFAQADTLPINVFDSTSQILSEAISELEVETPRESFSSRLNLKNIYWHILTDPLYRNSLFNMASTMLLGGLGFVFWIVIARLYKTEMVGVATTLISIMVLLSNFTIVGLNSSLMRYLPQSVNKNELINSAFVVVTFVALLFSAIFLLGLPTFSPQLIFLRSNLFYILSFTIFIIFYSWNSLLESIFMAFRSAGNILVKNTIISILKLVLPFALISLAAYGIFTSVASSLALGVLASLAILILGLKVKFAVKVNVALVKETLAYSFANYVTDFMFNMPSLVLPVIILNVLSAKYAAYYYIASMIQNILLIIPLAASQALLTEGAYNEVELKKHVKKAIGTIGAILVPTTAIIVFFGNILLQVFGKSYASEAFQFLQLYSVSTIFTALILVANAIMNVRHKIRLLVLSNIFASVLTLWLSYAFIWNKLVGIGWGWTLGQAISGLVAIVLIIRLLTKDPPSRCTIRGQH